MTETELQALRDQLVGKLARIVQYGEPTRYMGVVVEVLRPSNESSYTHAIRFEGDPLDEWYVGAHGWDLEVYQHQEE